MLRFIRLTSLLSKKQNMKCNTYIIFSDIAIKNKFAFVDFDDYRDAEDAVYDLHRKEFLGEIVSISYYSESSVKTPFIPSCKQETRIIDNTDFFRYRINFNQWYERAANMCNAPMILDYQNHLCIIHKCASKRVQIRTFINDAGNWSR